ncbi:DUF1702 family protein [Paludisphaera soli]|uniref:DUF1702 family protein n=1 Tax=Paludisphaera soli TaxID=2712865 RepID=UPI0013EC1D2C|nr:DUF1702 family protein [Paludisphaera soli]
MGWLRRRIFGIAPEETSVARRGFRVCEEYVARRLERVGRSFLEGYHAALEQDEPGPLAERLDQLDREDRGFAYEGAAMAIFLLDRLSPWRRERFGAFVAGPGAAHVYMMHVGAGWAVARLRCSIRRTLARFDPLSRWLVMDGYGFHHGYFQPRICIDGRLTPKHLSGYARRAFDQGLGRSLWFVEGTDGDRIASSIERFPEARRGDLWSGVGLACAYAGGSTGGAMARLRSTAGANRPGLAQGAAFAAKARERAGNPAPHTDLACRILCDMSAGDAARLTDEALADLPGDGAIPSFEVWRGRIRACWGEEVVTA